MSHPTREMKHPFMKILLTSLYALGIGSLLAVGANAQPNLLVAGDFEGITSITTYWPATTGVWGAESSALSGAANGVTPFGSQMLRLNHAGGGTVGQTAQIIQGPFKAGSIVTFTAKFNTWLTGQSVKLDIQTNASLALTGTRYSSPTVALDSNTSTWQTVIATTTLTSDTNYISAEILLSQNSDGSLYGQPRAYVDDAVLTVAPRVAWVNWTGTETASGITKYVGNMVVPRTSGGNTTVTVKYTPPNQINGGNGFPGIWRFQYTTGNPEYADYYANGMFGSTRNPARSPYTSAKVGNIPDGGGAASDQADIIELRYQGTNTLEFSDAGTGQPIAVASPVFAYVSLNGNGYGFNQDFDILSFGDGINRDAGYWGAGSSKKVTAVVGSATQYQLLQDTNPLGGNEPHGALQFRGAFSTVTWQSLSNEAWNGFTIGVVQLAADVPIANAGPDQTVNATSASGASVQLSGSVSGSTNAPFTYTWSGPFGTASGSNPTVTLAVGTHTLTLTVTDSTGSTDSDTVVITVLPNPAPVINSSSSANGTYGAPFSYTITATNSPTSFGATNLPAGLSITGAVISGTPTEAGFFAVQLSAQNSGGTGTKILSLNIAKANATVVVTPYSVTYDGNPHSATVTISGVLGETGAAVGTVTLSPAHTDAGVYADSWSFNGGSKYNNIASTPITNTINKANAIVTVNGYTGAYDAAAHVATGSAAGVGGVDLSAGLTLGATFTNVPGGTANWTFSGGTNYNNASGSVAIVITKANATVVVTPYNVTYDGQSHTATVASITGVNGETGATVGAVTLNTTHTNAGTYADSWSLAGAANYNHIASTAITNTIAKANAAVVITPYNVEYDAQPHSATVASITGVNGETWATVGTVTLNTTHTNVGIYSDTWSFTGAANYNNIAATPISNVIKDTTAPTITSLSTNAPTLWPPNHKMVAVTISATATDLVGVTSLKIVSATSNEPDNGLGDGDTAGDIVITGALTVNLRAERSGKGNGRTYTVHVEARDAAGNASTASIPISVPKSQGK